MIEAIVTAIQAPGVLVLDQSSDWDHNRSVVTVVGPPEAVCEGVFRAIRVAAQQISLFEHQGAHPRLGATDVVPLIPIEESSMEECVALAHGLGRRVGEELELPVYLYAAAATRLIHTAEASEREAIDLFQFTTVIKRALDAEGRRAVVELLWDMAYADGRADELEENIIWRIAELLGVPARERMEAKKVAAAQGAENVPANPWAADEGKTS